MEDSQLKITALQARIGELVSEYEGRIADLRVIITQQQASAEAQKQEMNEPVDLVEGDVV